MWIGFEMEQKPQTHLKTCGLTITKEIITQIEKNDFA